MSRILISIVDGKPVIHADEGVAVVWADRISDLIEFREPLVMTGSYDQALTELQEQAAEDARLAEYERLTFRALRTLGGLKPATFESMLDVLADVGRADPDGVQTAEQIWDDAFASKYGSRELPSA